MLETASATTPRLKADTLIEKLRRDEQNPNRKPNRRKFMINASPHDRCGCASRVNQFAPLASRNNKPSCCGSYLLRPGGPNTLMSPQLVDSRV